MSVIGLVWASERGGALAAHLAGAWPDTRRYPGSPAVTLPRAWAECDALVAFMAAGIAVRLAAPLLTSKDRDPGLVCVDDAGRFAVALSGGHAGGANRLAHRVADALGATAVVTTASDALGHPALDSLGADLGFRIDQQAAADLAAVGAALLAGEPLTLVEEQRWPLPPLPPNVIRVCPSRWPTGFKGEAPAPAAEASARASRRPAVRQAPGDPAGAPTSGTRANGSAGLGRPSGLSTAAPTEITAPCLVISDRLLAPPRPAVVYRPPSLLIGVGCSRGAAAEEILALIDDTLRDAGLAPLSVAGLASVDAKRDEPGLRAAASERGWPLAFHPAATLATIAVPNPSTAALEAVGTASVAEAAALAPTAAPLPPCGPGELLVPKRKRGQVTVAVARRRPRGRLFLIGTGPGDPALLPPLARDALARSELVVGLDRYLEPLRGLLRPGTRVAASPVGDEQARARLALAEARAGVAVALVSGGDAGVYGMASPALEQAPAADEVEVLTVPGVTAANAAAALLGAPLGHDHCAISLSDLLTPWPVIRERLAAAAAGDFVVALYNPRSAARHWQLAEARELLLAQRPASTPVGVVTDAFRPGQRVTLTTLGELDPATVGMTSIVLVGSSRTRVVAGRMVTPRGYR